MILTIIALTIAIPAAIFLLIKIIKSLIRREFGVDILALLAIVATLLAHEYLASIIIVIMMLTGEILERYAGKRAKRELTKLIDDTPKHVHPADGSDDILAAKVKSGTNLLIKTGELILLDGTLVSASATLDTAQVTGESLPRELVTGDKVISGSLNTGAPITVKTTASLKNSQFSQLAAAVQSIESHPARFVRLADRYAIPFTIVSLLIAGIAWAISGDFTRFAAVLVLASPCPLILSAPIAFISGMSQAFGQGILVKNGSNLEKLSNVRSIALDKTGTLSSGKLTVSAVTSFSSRYSKTKIIDIAAELERGSTHPLANAITEYHKDLHQHNADDDNFKTQEHTGLGIAASRGRQKFILGSLTYMRERRIPLRGQKAASAIYLASNKKLIGRIDFHDTLRAHSSLVIRDLKQLELKNIALVTGDNQAAAEEVAAELGIKTVFANQLPTDKVQTVKNLKPKPTLYVGDGMNDAPVLAAADVGIAMGAFGSPLAIESAGIVIMTDNISKIPLAIRIARATRHVATRSVLLGIGACIALMLVAAFGFIPVVIGALLQEAIDALSITSALAGKKVK